MFFNAHGAILTQAARTARMSFPRHGPISLGSCRTADNIPGTRICLIVSNGYFIFERPLRQAYYKCFCCSSRLVNPRTGGNTLIWADNLVTCFILEGLKTLFRGMT